MNAQTIRSSFADDHERLDQLLATYHASKRVDFDRAKSAFEELEAGLRRHILWEERVLFPLFEEKTGMYDRGPTVVMRAEHREIVRRLEAIHDKVRAGDVETDREEDALVEILAAHNYKEETILYPAIDRLLDDDEKAAAFRQMEELPAEAYQTCSSCDAPGHEDSERYSPNLVVALR